MVGCGALLFGGDLKMKTNVLTVEERVFTHAKGETIQGISVQRVCVQINTGTVCIAKLREPEATVMRDVLRVLVKDILSPLNCSLGLLVSRMDSLIDKLTSLQSSSPFAFDKNAGKDSKVDFDSSGVVLDGRKERDIRIKYQDLVYHAMNRLKQYLGVESITTDDFKLRCDELVVNVGQKVPTCCHPCCHNQAKILKKEDPKAVDSFSDHSEKSRFGLEDVPEMPEECSCDEHINDAKPRAVFKRSSETEDSCLAKKSLPLNPSIEIGEGLPIPVHSKTMFVVSPEGLAPFCNCSWSGCEHPDHSKKSESRVPPKSCGSDVELTMAAKLREAEDAAFRRRCGVSEVGRQNIPDNSSDVVPTSEAVDERPLLEMCACGNPGSCSHPSHKPEYLMEMRDLYHQPEERITGNQPSVTKTAAGSPPVICTCEYPDSCVHSCHNAGFFKGNADTDADPGLLF